MAPNSKALNDYERQRLDNIRRNNEMISALLLRRKASNLSSSLKPKPELKRPSPSTSSPIVIRRSLRTRGVPPSSAPSADFPPTPSAAPHRQRGPLLLREAFASGPHDSDSALVAAIAGSTLSDPVKNSAGFDPRSELALKPDNVAKVVNGRILGLQFLPFSDRTVIAAGSQIGDLGFWDVDSSEDDGNGIYNYEPHSASISGISVHPFSPRKIYTSSYDGFVRVMDAEKETFDMIICSDRLFYSICQWPQDVNSLYIGEGSGMLKVWDEREGKHSNFWELHDARINTVDFNSQNLNLMVTSSSDGSACIWDLRCMNKNGPECLKPIRHAKAVHSAYFSPGGNYLATTSLDDKVGIASGTNFDDLSLISHNNWTGRWLSTFRAIWGWDDSYLYIGNMKRAIDVISSSDRTTTALESSEMTSIPCRFAAHPCILGSLAGATSGGKVFLWTKE